MATEPEIVLVPIVAKPISPEVAERMKNWKVYYKLGPSVINLNGRTSIHRPSLKDRREYELAMNGEILKPTELMARDDYV